MMTTTMVSLVSSCVVAISILSHTASATSIVRLQKRKAILNESDAITIDGKAPLDAILLIAVALSAALFCLFLAIWNVCVPNHSGSRKLREERARAKTELRLKGGGGGVAPSPSPTRIYEKKRSHQSNGTATEVLSFDSHHRLVANPNRRLQEMWPNTPKRVNDSPKVAQYNGKGTRASRGYSSYSKHDIQSMSKDYEPSLSMLAVPTLPTSYSDNASSSHSVSSGSNTTSPPPIPWHARPSYRDQDRSQSFNGHTRRISTTVGRGTDLNRNRSGKSMHSMTRQIHVNPQAVDPTYSSYQRTSPRASASDLNDPLSGLELKRYVTDPNDSREGSRRNSTMNALDFFNHGGNRSYYNDTASDSTGHEYTGLTQPAPASPSGMTRTRNMHFFDAEQDAGTDASHVEYGGYRPSNSSRGSAGWKIWGNKV